jgi:TRAP-type C4-dicarboxylate transport system permease small subunit
MATLIKRLERIAMFGAAACVSALMLVVSYDAISRYLLGAPLQWAHEVVTLYLLVSAVYLALSATYSHGDHISIDLFQAKMPHWLRVGLDIVCSSLTIGAFTLILYRSSSHMIEAYVRKEFMPGYIVWPIWLSYLPVVIGSALLVLRLLHHSGMLAANGEDPNVASGGEAT